MCILLIVMYAFEAKKMSMLDLIIMNANGSVAKGLKVGEMDIPVKRDHARQKVIKDKNPDLILIQESDIMLEMFFTQVLKIGIMISLVEKILEYSMTLQNFTV